MDRCKNYIEIKHKKSTTRNNWMQERIENDIGSKPSNDKVTDVMTDHKFICRTKEKSFIIVTCGMTDQTYSKHNNT